MIRKILLLLAISAPLAAQTIAPNQIKPGNNGQVLTTVGGKGAWANNTASVTSVFGRIGDVTPQIGDYNCSQITSAVCALPALYNQVVQFGGASLTQRPNLNFIPSIAGAVVCADNPVNNSTDCTISGGVSGAIIYSISDVTGSRSTGTVYQNTTDSVMFIGGSVGTSGSGVGNIVVAQGPTAYTLNYVPWANQSTATVNGGDAGFSATIMPGYFYSVRVSGAVTSSVRHWTQITSTGSGSGGGPTGFPFYLGATSITAGSSNGAVTGLSVNGVTLDATGSSSQYLNRAGTYTTPSGGGGSTSPGGPIFSVQYSAGSTFGGVAFNGIGVFSTTAAPRVAVPTDFPQATSSTFGVVKPDNSTITISGGVLTAVGGGGGGGCPLGTCIQNNPTGNQGWNFPAGTRMDNSFNDWGTVNMYGGSWAVRDFLNYDSAIGWSDSAGTHSDTFNATGGWTNNDVWDWLVYSAHVDNLNLNEAGIKNGYQLVVRANGNGDVNLLDMHASNIGGCVTLADECFTGIQNKIADDAGPKVTTVSSGGTGAGPIGMSADNIGAGLVVVNASHAIATPNSVTLGADVAIGSAGGVAKILNITGTPLTSTQVGFGCGTTTADVLPANPFTGGNISATMNIALPSAFAQSSPTIAGVFALDTIQQIRITAVGAYSAGVQTVTADISEPIRAGAQVCIGGPGGIGMVAMQNNSITSWTPYMIYAMPVDTTHLVAATLNQGRISRDYVEAGAIVSFFPMAFIQSANQNTNIVVLKNNGVTWNVGDNVYVPNSNAQGVTFGNFGFGNHNPHAQFRGLQEQYTGVPFRLAGGGQFASIISLTPGQTVDLGASGCYNAGNCGYAPQLIDVEGAVGSAIHMHNFPAGAAWAGNSYRPSVIRVRCEEQSSSRSCNNRLLTYLDYNDLGSQDDDYLTFDPATSIWNVGGNVTAQTFQVNGSTVCTVANGLCSGGGGGGVTSIDSQTGAFTFSGAGVTHTGNAYVFSGTGGAGSVGGENEVQAADGAHGFLDTGCSSVSSYMQCNSGYRIGGATTSGHYLRNNGTGFVDGTIQGADLPIATSSVLGAVRVDGTTITVNSTTGVISSTGGSGGGLTLQTAGAANGSQTLLNFIASSTNATGLIATPINSAGTEKWEISGTINAANVATLNQNTTGTAANLSGTPALPNGTTASTQTAGDSTTKIATDAFVASAVAALGSPISGATAGQFLVAGSATTATSSVAGTGTGNVVRATSPTLITPALGTPSSGDASNLVNLNATQLTSGTVPSAVLPLATTAAFGAIKPDGTTCTTSAGVLSCTGSGGGFANPMTTAGDLIYGGASGTPTRLGGSTTNAIYYLQETTAGGVAGNPTWVNLYGTNGTWTAIQRFSGGLNLDGGQKIAVQGSGGTFIQPNGGSSIILSSGTASGNILTIANNTTTSVSPFTGPQLINSGSTPTQAAGAAAGTTPTCSAAPTGFNMSGVISCTTGTATTTGTLLTLTFGGTVVTAPMGCQLTPRNAASAAAATSIYSTAPSTTAWTIGVGSALAASTAYSWSYICQ